VVKWEIAQIRKKEEEKGGGGGGTVRTAHKSELCEGRQSWTDTGGKFRIF
jgi:hypothetical protein